MSLVTFAFLRLGRLQCTNFLSFVLANLTFFSMHGINILRSCDLYRITDQWVDRWRSDIPWVRSRLSNQSVSFYLVFMVIRQTLATDSLESSALGVYLLKAGALSVWCHLLFQNFIDIFSYLLSLPYISDLLLVPTISFLA